MINTKIINSVIKSLITLEVIFSVTLNFCFGITYQIENAKRIAEMIKVIMLLKFSKVELIVIIII